MINNTYSILKVVICKGLKRLHKLMLLVSKYYIHNKAGRVLTQTFFGYKRSISKLERAFCNIFTYKYVMYI